MSDCAYCDATVIGHIIGHEDDCRAYLAYRFWKITGYWAGVDDDC